MHTVYTSALAGFITLGLLKSNTAFLGPSSRIHMHFIAQFKAGTRNLVFVVGAT
jgi:hypothetical protein